MIGYTYKTTNLTNGKIYVGKHESEVFEPHKYIGSGKVLKLAIKKQREICKEKNEAWHKYFKCELLESCDSVEQLYEREAFWIEALNARNPDIGYNLSKGGRVPSAKGYKHTDETKRKLSEANTGRKHTQETKDRIKKTKAENPYIYTDEVRAKMSRARKGKSVGHPVTQETRDKISKANKARTGRPCPDKGQTRSPEFCAKVKESLKTAPLKRRKVVCVEEGVVFNSITEAANQYNCNAGQICLCCSGKRENVKTAGGYHWEYAD